MACLTKRGGIWTARIYLEGRERWRSLGTSDRQEAERKARDIEESVKGAQWVRRQLDDLLRRAQIDVHPAEAPMVLWVTKTPWVQKLIGFGSGVFYFELGSGVLLRGGPHGPGSQAQRVVAFSARRRARLEARTVTAASF